MFGPLALGGSLFGEGKWSGANKAVLLKAMERALELSVTHFDTAADYGSGESERVLGQFLRGKRDRVFLSSKASTDELSAASMLQEVEKSLKRLQTDHIDLYYIHWPRLGKDLRPLMEGLVLAKEQGKISFIGVSNFSVAQMEEVGEVGEIDAHQLGYNLFWRFAERDVIPYCCEKGIALVTYSSIAQGILTGKFARELAFAPGDQRSSIILFHPEVWPHLYRATEQLKVLAQDVNRPLVHLAIRWVLKRAQTAVVGAKDREQVNSNVAALGGNIPESVFERMTQISDEVTPHIPDLGNMYDYHP